MLKLRITVSLLILWLTLLFNIERLFEPINLASFVYVMAGLLAVGVMLTPKLRTPRFLEILGVTLPTYAVTKWSLGYSFTGQQFPITVTECVVLCVTCVIAASIGRQLEEFLTTAGELSAIRSTQRLLNLGEHQSLMYAEVQRARRFHRNLTLATVGFTGEVGGLQLDRLTRQARLEIVRKFLESEIANRLGTALSPGDLLVHHDSEFIMMFPEASEVSVRSMLQKVADQLVDELGVRLQLGFAQFPDEECTLTGLIERAESESRSSDWHPFAAERKSCSELNKSAV